VGDGAGGSGDDRLARLRARLEAAQRIAGLGSWEVDVPSGTAHWGPDLDPILGWAPGEGGHERLLAVVHPDDRARVAKVHADAVRTGTPYEVDHRILRDDGERHIHQVAVVEEEGGRPVRLVGTVQDVTDRTRLARRQAVTESRRRELLHRLVQASDAARSHLAGDLHDGPVQILTATAMRLEVIARTGDAPPPWVEAALPPVREVCAQLREILYELHPHGDDGGVRDAIGHVGSTVLPGTPLAVTVQGEEPGREASRAVHAVVQEAMWDVREHDSAEELSIEVRTGDVTHVVVGGGRGDGPLLTRVGLLGVRERCEAIGGTAELDASGRVLRCALPTAVAGA